DKIIAQIKLLTPQKLADFFHQAVVEPQGMAILSQIAGSQNGNLKSAQDGIIVDSQSVQELPTAPVQHDSAH
ncbi:hypothetical protein MJM59_29760, partial [Salmonella enterica subsp. enterica serovar Montevideo]|nr:hypothetical protein [Salmonella enterica subsp. enterica serovar Montevideo]